MKRKGVDQDKLDEKDNEIVDYWYLPQVHLTICNEIGDYWCHPRYTSGDMAGLAIGMVFGGLLLAGVHNLPLLLL